MAKKVLVIYGSTTGMNETASEYVEEGLIEAGCEVERKNVIDAEISDLDDYEFILLGSSTWDDGQLQYDMDPFHDDLLEKDLSGKKFAVFGTGDPSYGEDFGKATMILAGTIESQGGELLLGAYKIEHDLSDERLAEVKEWGKKVGGMI